MFNRFWKNKDDGSSKSGPPGHRGAQSGSGDAAGGGAAAPEPVGGGFFNLPPTVGTKGSAAYGAPGGAPSAAGSQSGSGAPSQYGRPASNSGGHHSVPTYGAPQPPSSHFGQPQPPSYGNHAPPPAPATGGGSMDMFGGMSVKSSAAVPSGYGGAPQTLKPSPIKYGGYSGPQHHEAAPNVAPAPAAGGSLFSGLDVVPGGASGAPAPAGYGHQDEIVRPGTERKKSIGRSGGTFNYLDVAASSGGADPTALQRPSVGAITRPGGNKGVKKKKTKSFRPGFGRQLSDESIAALQRGDLNADDVMQQHQPTEESAPTAPPRMATNPNDLAHLLPPVKGGSVLAGLTVHDGGSTVSSSGGSVLAGLTVHGGTSPRGSSRSSPTPSEGGLLAGLNVHRKASVDELSDASTSVVLPSSGEKKTKKKKSPPPEPEKPAAPPTPEEKLMNTLRDFHASAVNFRDSTMKQNDEENKIVERKIQLAKQLTQYEIDLRTIEAQQQQAVEVEDFEKADALNGTINSVRHCITLSESDVRKVDSELVAFVKAKERAFVNQLRSTRGTLKELEKFRDDQDAERSTLHDELKKYEVEETEHLQFEAERIDTELNHVSSNMDHLKSEKEEIESTIEEQCKTEISLREELLVEKAGVHEEIVELERQLRIKVEQMRGIQASIDKAENEIDAVRSRYSRQLKRIADREDGLLKTKSEVEADADQLKVKRTHFAETVQDYGVRIAAFGKRMKVVKKEMRAAMLLATVLEVQETRRDQATVRRKQQTAELTALADSAAIAEQSFELLRKQHDELEKSLTVHHNAIASAQAMIPQLEQEKKAAATQRNFKEAARISKDIKALEKDQSTAEEMVEVVEMELQDLTERIEKREVEWKEKKEELKTVEKQLELNTLNELWKEAKSLRRSLRKFDNVKSEGIAAADGVDFRSSALLLVQAEYDVCIAQAEALESKYDLTDPTAEEEDEEVSEDDDDESDDGELDGHFTTSSDPNSGYMTGGNGPDYDQVAGYAGDAPVTLEKIAERVAELECLIEEATENEEYERAAKLDEQLEALRQRESSLKATMGSTIDDTVIDDGGVIHDNENDQGYDEYDGAESGGEDGEEEANTPEELEDELRLVRARIRMLEADIERDTENEDYEAAAQLEEELQQLREEESEIGCMLADSQAQADGDEKRNNTDDGEVDGSSAQLGGLFAGLSSSSAMSNATPEAVGDAGTSSMFSGLQVTAAATDVEEEIVGKAEVSENSDEPGSSQSPKETPVSPRHISIGSGSNSPRRKSSVGMFSGLQVSSESVGSPEKSTIDSNVEPVENDNPPMFEGLQLGSLSSASPEQSTSTAEVSVFDGLVVASSPVDAAHESSSSVQQFGGMTLTTNADETTTSDDGVIIDAEEAMDEGKMSLEEGQGEDATDETLSEVTTTTADVSPSPLDMFGGLSLAPATVVPDSTTDQLETTTASSVHAVTSSPAASTTPIADATIDQVETSSVSATDTASSSLDMFGGLSLAPAAATTDTTNEEAAESTATATTIGESEVPASPVDMFGGLSLAPIATATDDVKPSAE